MQLVIKKADGSQQSVSLSPDKPLKLGADPSADIVVAAPGMQKVHCGFMHKDGKFYVVATKASQQVHVNGQAVQSSPLAAGHQIKLPGAQILVQEDQPADDDFGLLPLEGEKPAAPPAPKPAEDEFGLAPLDGEPAPKPVQPSQPAASQPAAGGPALQPVDDEFGLAPLDGEPAPKPKPQPTAPVPAAGLQPIDDKPALQPVDDEFGLAPMDAPAAKAPAPKPKQKPAPASDAGPSLQPVDDEFGLADEPATKAPAKKKKQPAPDAGLQPLDDAGLEPLGEVGLTPLEEAPAKKKGKQAPAAGGLAPLDELPADGGLAPLDELPGSGGLAPLDEIPASGGLAPLDELSSDAMSAPLDDALSSDALAAPAPAKVKKPSAFGLFLKSPAFKSLAMGIAALAALGLALLIAFTLPTADSRFAAADANYRGKQFDRATEDFNNFLSWHANDPRAGEARAKRALCQLLPLAGQKNWPGLLVKTKSVIAEIGGDARHEEFRRQLGAMLPQAVVSLTDRAESNARKQPEVAKSALAEAQDALALTNKYVPPALAAAGGVPQAEVRLVQLSRDLALAESHDAALAQIKQAAGSGKLEDAYRARRELLLKYPKLSSGLQLQSAMEAVAAAERGLVKYAPLDLQVSTDEPESRISKTLVPIAWSGDREGGTIDAQRVVCLASPAAGAVYGIDAASGGLLWRRYVGSGLKVRPQLVGDPPAGVIVVNLLAGAVQRLELATGKLVWQAVVPNLCGSVTVAEDEVLVPTYDGMLVRMNASTGAAAGQFQLPQPLTSPPVVDPLNRSILQPGEHSNLYVLTADNLCDQVAYIGHETAGLTLAPVMLDRFLLVFENGLDETTIHVFQRSDLKQVQSVTLDGLVAVDPLATEDALYVSTTRGTVLAFELDAAKPKQPLAAFPPIDSGLSSSAGVALAGDRLWVAGRGLRVFDLPLDRKQPEPSNVLFAEADFNGPPQVEGETVISARNDPQAAGMVLAGSSAKDQSPLWQTQLAPPGALVAAATGDKLWVLHAGGALFELAADALVPGAPSVLSKPTASVDVRGQLSTGSGQPWGDDQAVLAPRDFPGLFVAGGENKFRVRSLPGPLAADPQRVGEQLLIATVGGPIFLVDPTSDSTPGVPFLPRIEAGKLPQWRGPALVGGTTVLVADGHNTLYKLTISGPGRLSQAQAAAMPNPIVTPLAAAGSQVWGVDAQGTLVAFNSDSLQTAVNVPLDAPAAFGPLTLGDRAILATADGRLLGLGPDPNPLWQVPLDHGALAGAVRLQDRLILASRSGVIFGLHPNSGQPTGAAIDVGQPLAGSPVVMGKHLIIPGNDGSLHVVSDAINLLTSGAPATAAR